MALSPNRVPKEGLHSRAEGVCACLAPALKPLGFPWAGLFSLRLGRGGSLSPGVAAVLWAFVRLFTSEAPPTVYVVRGEPQRAPAIFESSPASCGPASTSSSVKWASITRLKAFDSQAPFGMICLQNPNLGLDF